MSDLYRLVYASKNLLQGSEAENSDAITQILETSQRNNKNADVTGALMFNGGAFAQVLEGPRQGVEDTFERIQRDLRHGDVTVLQCAPVESRGFQNWSMAFVGQSSRGQTLWSSLAAASDFDLSRLEGNEVFAMLHGLVLEQEGVGAGTDASRLASELPTGSLDVAQVRKELEDLRPENRLETIAAEPAAERELSANAKARIATRKRRAADEDGSSSKTALMIFRAALASERDRTTSLRHELDDLQVLLAEANDRVGVLLRERDLWAARARQLATALRDEADAVAEATQRPAQEQNRGTLMNFVAA